MYSMTSGADGRAYLTWIEPVPAGGHVLRFSRLDGGAWGPAREIARGDNWFVNWADRPSLTALPDGTLMAHWLINTGRKAGAYGYGVHVALSADAGDTWRTVFDDGMENVSDYSGFLTFAPGGGGADAVYLTPVAPDDGSSSGHEHEPVKTLAAVRLGPDGRAEGQTVVDADVCSCCNTDVARTADGLVAVYRDHLPGEIRDISIVRHVGGRWSEPAPVHRDGWEIGGCPTNGPAVVAENRRVAVAWFTAAGQTPRVKVAFSGDGGASFAAPIVVDEGTPVGWPRLAWLDDGSVAVSWLEGRGQGVGDVLVRRVTAEGHRSAPVTVATAASGRSTGQPQMVRSGDRLIVAWRQERVLTASLAAGSLMR